MADKKISALTSASTPLAGTEVLPIVQSGATVKVSVANLTAGRSVATAGGSFTDNISQNTAAKGVNFTANSATAGMTSQLLNWYEEGTWTPDQGAGLTVVGAFSSSGKYTRVGRMMVVQGTVSGATSVAIAGTASQICTNLPYNCSGGHSGTMFNAALGETGGIAASAGIVYAVSTMAATTSITFTITYQV